MKWLLQADPPPSFFQQFPERPPIVARLLYHRGLRTQVAIDEFLNPDYGSNIHDPFAFREMKKAVERILQAIDRAERIVIQGDYDADGVCAASILRAALIGLGAKQLHVHLPHREREGYGLRRENVEEYAATGTKLIITCDCGTANVEEVELAKERGMDVIITDHHEELPHLPKPYAFLNPKLREETYPFRFLAGGGVAFKLAQALSRASLDGTVGQYRNLTPLPESFEKWLLDLVAISTVTDMMPLLGENRTLVRYGLIVLRKTRRVGLQQLIEVARINPEKVDAFSIGFQIGPRINAAGRIDHANAAFALLNAESEPDAERLAEELNAKNVKRQQLTEKVFGEAIERIGPVEDQRILLAFGEGWPVGILGLVAGKLTDAFQRPAFVGVRREDEIVASGRSIESFDITAALKEVDGLLKQYGGHRQACGFVMLAERESAFREAIAKIAEGKLKEDDLTPQLSIDADIPFGSVTWKLVEELEQFEPFGEGNPRPRFLIRHLSIQSFDRLGSNSQHVRLLVTDQQGQTVRKLLAFRVGPEWGSELAPGHRIDAVAELSVNEWNGQQELELKLIDYRQAE